MEDAGGGIHSASVTDVHEPKEGMLMTALACAAARTQMRGADSLPKEWWKPLEKEQVKEIALGFGYFCSSSGLTPIPEEWLTPRLSDYVYCDFSLENGQMLALLVRTIETKAGKQEFVLAVNEHNQVFLVKSCELHGLFSKEVVIDVCKQDDSSTTLRIPLTALSPEHRQSFSKFLALDCVKNLANRRLDHLPEGLFETHLGFGT